MRHRLISNIKDKKGNRHEIISVRLKGESYKLFHKRHDFKVTAKRWWINSFIE